MRRYKGVSEKYKGKYAVEITLLLFFIKIYSTHSPYCYIFIAFLEDTHISYPESRIAKTTYGYFGLFIVNEGVFKKAMKIQESGEGIKNEKMRASCIFICIFLKILCIYMSAPPNPVQAMKLVAQCQIAENRIYSEWI